MIKQLFLAMRDKSKPKSTNPFLVALFSVWVIINWKLVYSFFNFDSDTKLDEKITCLESYLQTKTFMLRILEAIGITFLVLIVTYILLNISRFVVNFFEKSITPWIYKLTDKGSVVKKSDFIKLEEELVKLENKFEEERIKRNEALAEIEKLEKKLAMGRID